MAVPAEIRRNATLVVVAAALYLGLQMLLAGFARPLGPYERGLFGSIAREDLWVVRLAMMVLSSLVMLAAYRSWVRPGGKTAWAGAGLFAVSWAPLYYGGEVRPEVIAALAAVAASGSTVRWLVERDRAALIWVALALLILVALMPSIGAVTTVVLAVVVAVWARTGGGPALIAIGAGLVLGRLAAGALRTIGRGRFVATVEQSLHAGAPSTAAIAEVLDPTTGTGALIRAGLGGAALLALVALAVIWWRWPHRRNAARTGAALAAVLTVATFVLGASTPASFLPALGLVSIPVGAGLLAAWRSVREAGSIVATIAYVAVVVAFVVWQGAVTLAAARA